MKFKLSLLPILVMFLCSCQSTETHKSRGLASAGDEAELESSFDNLFQGFLEDTEGKAKILEPFAKTSLQVLKRSYYYLERFDVELDRIHKACIISKRKAGAKAAEVTCESAMDLPDYRKLQASRIVFERQKAKLEYYHMRLLDLANAQDKKLKMVFESTERYLSSLDEAGVNNYAATARGILTQWSTELRDLISVSTEVKSPMSYELAIDLFKLKESSQEEWSELAGKAFKSSGMLNDHKDVSDYYMANKKNFIKERAKAAKKAMLDQVKEVYDSLNERVMNRGPQSVSWKNHTGRNFARGEWALTYDDGPKASTTNQILDTLASKGWHATFFWLAKNARAGSNVAVIERAKNMGMGLASHSYSHANLGKSGANLGKEIGTAKEVLEGVYGMRLNYFRLPYGSGTKSARVKNMITSLDMEHFFWNVDSLDWKASSPSEIYIRTKKQMDSQGKGILLFHDIHQRTVDTTKLLARKMPNLNVIPLERGNGIASSANGSKKVVPPEPATEPFEPHRRRITVKSHMNVRSDGPETDVCGVLKPNDEVWVEALGDNGHYQIDTYMVAIYGDVTDEGDGQHNCEFRFATFSADGRFSEKIENERIHRAGDDE